MTLPAASALGTRRGKLTLVFLCAVAFLDFVDASIVNVALPSIRTDLHFSVQDLQWVLSAYLVTYGGFLLLGGRISDLLGRRRVLVSGIVMFAVCSLASGLAQTPAQLIGARLVQGIGAALMLPAALSALTTAFPDPADRFKAMGAWGAVAGLASAAGVFLGGVISDGPGWRWVFFVNLPLCAVDVFVAYRLLDRDARDARRRPLDARGAALVTSGMLLLIYTLVRAPEIGWGATRTVLGFVGAGALLVAFVLNELRHRSPLLPLSIFRTPGLVAADATQVIAMAGFYGMFFFVTLYMQNVLRFSPLKAGAAYLPVTVGIVVASGVASKLFSRIGTRPVIVVGAFVSAVGVFLLSQVPVHGTYAADVLPGLVVMSLGLGAVFVGVTTAANAGVSPDQAGLAAGLLNTAQWLGSALGLAVLSAVATSRTHVLQAAHAAQPVALTGGFQRALFVASGFLVLAVLVGARTIGDRGTPTLEDELVALEPA